MKPFLYNCYISCLIIFIVSCAPHVKVKLTNSYPQEETDTTVTIYSKKVNQIPSQAEKLGTVKITCYEMFTKDCDDNSVITLAKNETLKAGGNAIVVTKHKKKSSWNNEMKFHADILKVHDFSSPNITYKKINAFDFHGKGTFDLRISFPYINFFTLKFKGENKVNTEGFMGALIGFDYYHKNNQYASLFVGGGMNFLVP
ncbi:MAG: hypothetical protein LBC68_12090, partial [Prevotellaceae bacterium]|nr:hypothetical protein [Prevotellaceae bacterium]